MDLTNFENSSTNNTLSYSNFINIVTNQPIKPIQVSSSDQYEKLFKILDTENKGYLTKSNWQSFTSSSPDQILFQYFSNNNSKIPIETFLDKLFNLNNDKDSINKLINVLIFLNKDTSKQLNVDEFNSLLSWLGSNQNKSNIDHFTDSRDKIDYLLKNLNINLSNDQIDRLSGNVNYLTLHSSLSKLNYLSSYLNQIDTVNLSDLKQNLLTHFSKEEIDLLLSLTLSNNSSSTDVSARDFNLPLIPKPAPAPVKQVSAQHQVLESVYSFVLGSIAGCIGATIVYPIDLIKTRMQAQKNLTLYKNSIDCLIKTVKRENIRGLYSGINAQLIGVAPEKAIKLTVNDLVRSLGTDPLTKTITPSWEILSGCSAGACQVLFTNPLEIVKIRLQMQGNLSTTVHKTLANNVEAVQSKSAMDIVKELGLRGLYKGSSACLLRDIPFSAIYFPVYANLKKIMFGYDPSSSNHLKSWQLLFSGALAGAPAAFFTTPFDVIKTRLQIKNSRYTTISSTFKIILVEEGPKAFFKGSLARVFRSSPQFGFTLATYEIFQNYLGFDKVFYGNSSSGEIKRNTLTNDDMNRNYLNKINSINKKLIDLNFGN